MKSATAYERNGKLFIFGQSKTIMGLWIEERPTLVIQKNEVAEIRKAVLNCLHLSKDGVPHPRQEDWPKLNKEFAESLGVKSFSAFAKTARCVNISQDGGIIRLVPTQNRGSKIGFTPLEDKSQTLRETDDGLGEAVIFALSDSK
ncbi:MULTISPECIES: hypothetical protein [unclassified Mesorhizobium]|uniref:hypothetical protein n=1 Tax=unclassified Mesorhizobium TaxID=325217 RepID=UPI0003CFBCC4|nr:hypothetical protein [Mesorhizobium sp. L2C067A000]ESZ31789.1 hypothetical protein X733_19975 [Mesorhizobium sp. L2C067A000]